MSTPTQSPVPCRLMARFTVPPDYERLREVAMSLAFAEVDGETPVFRDARVFRRDAAAGPWEPVDGLDADGCGVMVTADYLDRWVVL